VQTALFKVLIECLLKAKLLGKRLWNHRQKSFQSVNEKICVLLCI